MSINITARPFAYNTGSNIGGTQQIGDLSVGIPSDGFPESPDFWNGPNEELGYVIAYPQTNGLHPTPISGKTSFVGFWRSKFMTDESFLALVLNKTGQTFATGLQAKAWLNNNGYWTSYLSPILSLDAGNMSSYSGSGTVWTDLVGGKTFNLINGPGYNSGNGGKLSFNASSGQYAQCNSSLPNLNTWSIAVWHYYTGTNVGSGGCLVTEVYPGSTSRINYSLGDNYDGGYLSAGFFDGGWRTSGTQSLPPNNWYHIIGTYDGSIIKLYVNGALVQSNSYSGTPISSNGGIRLMRRWDNPDYWGGSLATVDIYDRSMNGNQVTSLFNRTKSRFGL